MTSSQTKRFMRDLNDIEHLTKQLLDEGSALIERSLMRAGADGYPPGAMGGGGGSDPADGGSTPTAALWGYVVDEDTGEGEWVEGAKDTVLERAERMAAHVAMSLKDLERAIVDLHRAKRIQTPPGRHSNMPDHCKACDRLVMCTAADPLTKRYCRACNMAWRRWKDEQEAEGHNVGADEAHWRKRFEVIRFQQVNGHPGDLGATG